MTFKQLWNPSGFTLPELLSAMAVTSIGLAGLLAVVPVASQNIQEGNNISTATFLAEQRLEQVKNQPWDSTGIDCIGVSPGSPNPSGPPTVPAVCRNGALVVGAGGVTFPDETPMGGQWSNYNRFVRITNCAVAPGCAGVVTPAGFETRLITVTVSPTTAGRGRQKSAVLTLLVSKR